MAVAFGTSGLRGPAADFTPALCTAYISAFLARTTSLTEERVVYLGGDLRQSTPEIAAYCLAGAKASGWQPVWAGNVPTPALAFYAMERDAPAIMITGSHIPETYNGIKFYRPDGEFLKDDEEPVRLAAEAILPESRKISAATLGVADGRIAEAYIRRYVDAFGPDALSGIRLGVDLHSAVGRDLMVAILSALGADCMPFRRSDHFLAVDTEALDPADVARSAAMIVEHGLDGVVSTDGDGDRPLVIDRNGQQVNGDILGALAARALDIDCVITPLTSTSAIEQSGWFAHVGRTRIGSPFVVAALDQSEIHPAAGFEANGGFLLEDDLALDRGKLGRLPTRDAMLPIIAVLADCRKRSRSLAELASDLPSRTMLADRVKNVSPEAGRTFLASILSSRDDRLAFHPLIADPVDINTLDGVRLTLSDGATVHFRQSGNAPEMRCYVETPTRTATQSLLADLMALLAQRFLISGDQNG